MAASTEERLAAIAEVERKFREAIDHVSYHAKRTTENALAFRVEIEKLRRFRSLWRKSLRLRDRRRKANRVGRYPFGRR